jgi:flagellar basal-body rod protein FlgC
MSEFDVLSVAADGMSVQRTLLDVAARNVAAAQAATPQHPYPRLVARFAAAESDDRFEPGDGFEPADDGESADDVNWTRFAGTMRGGDTADSLTEMIAVLDAQRAYEANASVFDVGKKLAERTLDVGRT